MGFELITADLLRVLVRANVDRRTGVARMTSMGWILCYEQWAVRSVRIEAPRAFQTLDAVANAAREFGLLVLNVELEEPAPPAPVKPRVRRARKR